MTNMTNRKAGYWKVRLGPNAKGWTIAEVTRAGEFASVFLMGSDQDARAEETCTWTWVEYLGSGDGDPVRSALASEIRTVIREITSGPSHVDRRDDAISKIADLVGMGDE